MMAKEYAPPGTLTKTSIMLGCGETPDQVLKTMEKVRAAGVDVMTFGQYMRPSKRHMPVSEYITPEAFDKYQVLGMEMVCFSFFIFHWKSFCMITSSFVSLSFSSLVTCLKLSRNVLKFNCNHFLGNGL